MLRYANTDIVFQEIPDETTLAISISGCPCRCPGCHSPHLWNNIGTELDARALTAVVAPYAANITTVAFMGGDADPAEINHLAKIIRLYFPKLKIAWLSGRTCLAPQIDLNNFHYIKLGPYIAHLGALRNTNTNQRLYRVVSGTLHDITHLYHTKTLNYELENRLSEESIQTQRSHQKHP